MAWPGCRQAGAPGTWRSRRWRLPRPGGPRGRPSSAAGLARSPPMTVPARTAGGAIRSSRPAAAASAASDRFRRRLQRRRRHARSGGTPRGPMPPGARRRPRRPPGEAPRAAALGPSRPTTQPRRPIAAAAAAVSSPARRSSQVIAGARACPSAAVATSVGPCPTTHSATGSAGPSTAAWARAIPIPRASAAHQSSGRCSARPGAPSRRSAYGMRPKPRRRPSGESDPRLDGGGAEVDGDDDARIGGHGHEW